MYSATWGQPKVAQLYLEKEEEGGGEKRSGGRKEEKVSRRIKPEDAGWILGTDVADADDELLQFCSQTSKYAPPPRKIRSK